MASPSSPFDNLSALERQRIKRENKYSHKYRNYYSELLKNRKEILQKAISFNSTTTTSEESRLIEEIKISEFTALGIGIVCGFATFGAIRFAASRWMIKRLGGESKLQKAIIADEEAKKLGIYNYQRFFRFILEGTFSFWVGNRAYHFQSKRSEDAYDSLSKIPLCSGRSILADGLCNEWIDITTKQIPIAFWRNLQQKDALGKDDEKLWQAIARFSNNCIKRRAYERQIRREQEGRMEEEESWSKTTSSSSSSDDDEENVIVVASVSLPNNVPLDVKLTQSEVDNLIQDSPSSA